ncbi:MAG: hypothetical protein A4S09_08930 [Proteobacteria bacterium SG_bin7]|nr:MAG: hypothetical protein A4S09_08930 [Proteobacteria bacterium SG_bin7]
MRTAIGLHACREVLAVRPKKIKKAVLSKDWERSGDLKEIRNLLHNYKVQIEYQALQQMDRIGSQHQGIAFDVNEVLEPNWPVLENKDTLLVVGLDGIEDPHNLGAMIRSSWLLGVDAILTLKNRSVGLTPTVHKTASGGVEHVPIEFHASLQSSIEWLKEKGVCVMGLSEKGNKSLFDVEIPSRVLWLVGGEEKGIRKSYQDLCDELVSIPQVIGHHSFNASVALGITLAETWRQTKN